MRVFRFRCSMLNELLVAICWVYVVFSNFLSNVMTVVFGFGAYVLFIFLFLNWGHMYLNCCIFVTLFMRY